MRTPTSHTPRPGRIVSLAPLLPPPPSNLTSLHAASSPMGRVACPCTKVSIRTIHTHMGQLSHAAAPSSTAQLTGNALAACAGLQRWPAPSSPIRGLPPYSDILLCRWIWLPTHTLPYHSIPCPIHASGAVHIIDDAASSRLPHWHIGTPEPHRTLTSPHLTSCSRLQLAITS
jgi:hypothetical protein